MATASSTLIRDTKVLSVVGAGHMMSHVFHYTLPPLFAYIKVDYGLSYTQLGLLMTIPKLFSWAWRMKRGPIEMWTGSIPARIPMIDTSGQPIFGWGEEGGGGAYSAVLAEEDSGE